MGELGRVADPSAFDREGLVTARVRVGVPVSWALATLDITLPKLLACAACDGGGCDRCQRSGALRSSGVVVIRVQLPAELARGVVLRVPDPFTSSDDTPVRVDVLLVEVVPAEVPAASCRRVEVAPSALSSQPMGRKAPWLPVALAVVALLLVIAFAMRG
ncbi:MAG: hypothetical protein U0271_36165 [Polyangiaceae bacterium]